MGIYEKVTKKDNVKSITKVFTAEGATKLSEGWSDSGVGLRVLNTSHTINNNDAVVVEANNNIQNSAPHKPKKKIRRKNGYGK